MRGVSDNVLVSDAISCLRVPKTQMVTFQSGFEKVTGFLALTVGPSRQGAVIAIHEWWGLNDWVKEQAKKLAANGYVVLAVDLYRGKVTAKSSEARKLKRYLPADRAIRDLKAAFDYLACRPDVDPKHISSIGWSMGGCMALQLAIHEPRIAACVVNYGSLPTELVDIQKINAQVLGIFGVLDRGIPPDKVRAFENGMNAVKKSVDIKIYDGAGHAFQNPANKTGYRPEATADAWLRTITFFEKCFNKETASDESTSLGKCR
jgi:carboxymethylenebutenolidase